MTLRIAMVWGIVGIVVLALGGCGSGETTDAAAGAEAEAQWFRCEPLAEGRLEERTLATVDDTEAAWMLEQVGWLDRALALDQTVTPTEELRRQKNELLRELEGKLHVLGPGSEVRVLEWKATGYGYQPRVRVLRDPTEPENSGKVVRIGRGVCEQLVPLGGGRSAGG
jgi:hypothetical protein